MRPLPFLWFTKAHWRSLKKETACNLHTFYTKGVISSEHSPSRVLVNGGNSVPGGLTQLGLGLGQGLGRDWVRGASDHPGLYSPLSLSWVYLHVRPDRFMTMDYFLLLCSLLLPVVSAVEGKKSHPQLVQLRCGMPKAYFPPCQVSQHPCLSEAGRRSG